MFARALAACFLAAAPAAHAAPGIEATPRPTGWVSITVTGEAGSQLAVREGATVLVSGRMRAPDAELPRAVPRTCDTSRTFTVTDSLGASDSASVRTPSCAGRLRLYVERRERELVLTVVDRFELGGFAPRLCARPPGLAPRCAPVAIPAGSDHVTLRQSRAAPGLWRFSLSTPVQVVRESAFVSPPGGLRVLATGDSMMMLSLDDFLARRLAREEITVRSEVRPGSGITKPFVVDWLGLARQQAAARPAATVVFLGANDGLPIGPAQCCGEAWIERYAQRAEQMMRSWSRGGAGRVYWLSLPVPGWRELRPVFRAVNAAVARAAARAGDGVRIVDAAGYFTPRGYRAAMRVGGRRVRVRRRDGTHLNGAGAALATRLVLRAMRRDGLVR